MKISPNAEIEAIKCFRCGLCQAWCPTFDVKKNESWNARGRIMLIRALMRGDLPPSLPVLERIYSCSLCRSCEVSCPPRVKVANIIEEARTALVEVGQAPLLEHKELAETVATLGNIFGQPPALPGSVLELAKQLPEKSENLLYMGCVAGFTYSKHAEILMKILVSAGFPFTLAKEGEACCGAFLKLVGLTKEFQEIIQRNAAKFEEKRVERLITLCPMCYTTFSHHYSAKGRFEVLHATELLQQLIREGKIAWKREVKMRATYHDPCHLGRYSGVYDAPREVLGSIPRLRFREMGWSRNSARCCGGTVRIPFVDIRNGMCEAILSEANKVRATAIATACPTCFHNLNSVSGEQKILDISELVAYSAGIVKRIPVYAGGS